MLKIKTQINLNLKCGLERKDKESGRRISLLNCQTQNSDPRLRNNRRVGSLVYTSIPMRISQILPETLNKNEKGGLEKKRNYRNWIHIFEKLGMLNKSLTEPF